MNYNEKAPDYFSNIRKDLINLIDANAKDLKILEKDESESDEEMIVCEK
jgi:hypothetical protein